jgi:hypothetical protein
MVRIEAIPPINWKIVKHSTAPKTNLRLGFAFQGMRLSNALHGDPNEHVEQHAININVRSRPWRLPLIMVPKMLRANAQPDHNAMDLLFCRALIINTTINPVIRTRDRNKRPICPNPDWVSDMLASETSS